MSLCYTTRLSCNPLAYILALSKFDFHVKRELCGEFLLLAIKDILSHKLAEVTLLRLA
ncbi:MAG: hypothetical protein FKGGLIKP_00469 [Sodalis sp. Fse]|nr:MAG: hypothetical protein FKGGLIKP_00469 [Sodalis sp. Fse]